MAGTTVALRFATKEPGPPRGLVRELTEIRLAILEAERRLDLDSFGPNRESARNLLHYLMLRHFDLREVQQELADRGLSSLGRAEGHVLYNLNAVLSHLAVQPLGATSVPSRAAAVDPHRSRQILEENTVRLLGGSPEGRETRIMVTMPAEAAQDPKLVRDLLEGGMDCMRINCAHDGPEAWARMITNLREAEGPTGRNCRILMDVGGPRLRTGPLPLGPAVRKVRPQRDEFGKVVAPAEVVLVPRVGPRPPHSGALPSNSLALSVPSAWFERRRAGEELHLRDARGARRTLHVRKRSESEAVATLEKSAYLTNGLVLEARTGRTRADRCRIAGILPQPGGIRLAPNDELELTFRGGAGASGRRSGRHATTHQRASIGVSLPSVLDFVRVGHRVWFDGGRIGGRVVRRTQDGQVLHVDHAAEGGSWLRADQGINLPDTHLRIPPLTEQDRSDLRFIVDHADMVGYSFVQSATDVHALREELRKLGRPEMGIVLKIETRAAFEHLPEILLEGLRDGPVGVMVARGDLAVEVGFERLAEVQEEILWLSEAAHVPSVWATQVLEGMTKSGLPTRAEITDAAMGERAECVMLNKGPYLVSAVHALDSILRRMQAHQEKKSSRLRHLEVAERFLRNHAGSLLR